MAVTSNRLGCQSSVCTSQECNHRFTVILNLDICLAGVNRSVSMDTRAVNTVFRQTRIIEVAVSGSAQEIAIHQQKFDLYMNEHPNVTIKPVDLGSERFQKLMTLIGADNAPDIIYLNEWTYVMANKGVLLGLNDLIEKDQFDTSVYPESLLTPLRYENELYALPQEVSPFVIYYNKEMFEAANVPLPTDDWTIDEFYAAAEALTNPAEKVYGYRHPGAWADQVLGWLSRAGVDFDISGTEVKGLDTPEALNALTFLHNLVVKDELSPNPAALLNQKIRGVNAYRSAFFIPVIVSYVSITMVWQWLYNEDYVYMFEQAPWLVYFGSTIFIPYSPFWDNSLHAQWQPTHLHD